MKGPGRSRTLQASSVTSTACMAGTTGVAWEVTPQNTVAQSQPYP